MKSRSKTGSSQRQTIRKSVIRTSYKRITYKRDTIKQFTDYSKISYRYPIFYVPFKSEGIYKQINNYVVGLQNFDVLYSQKYNKVVYLLGEIHSFGGWKNSFQPRITAEDFFFNLTNYTNKFLDIFLEDAYYPNFHKTNLELGILTGINDSYMTKTIRSLMKINLGITYNNTRIHSADIRLGGIDQQFLQYRLLIHTLLYSVDTLKKDKFCNNSVISNLTKEFTSSDKILNDVKKFLTDNKILRQYNNIKDLDIKDYLYKKFDSQIIQSNILNYDNILHLIEALPTNRTKFQEGILEIVNYLALFMDLYLFSRIFRSFRNIKGVYSEDPKNIIVYAGAFHTDNYKNWLEEIGFKSIYSTKADIGTNSVEITGFTPVFLD